MNSTVSILVVIVPVIKPYIKSVRSNVVSVAITFMYTAPMK